MLLAYGHDEAVANWVAERTRLPDDSPSFAAPFSTIGVVDGRGVLHAGVVYHSQWGSNITITVAGDGSPWARPQIMVGLFHFPFVQLGLRRITAFSAKGNRRARKFIEHAGFTYEGCLRDALPKDHVIIYGMRRDECRWLGNVTDVRIEQRTRSA